MEFREEQLKYRVTPSQAEPFFPDDLTAVSHMIATDMQIPSTSPVNVFLFAKDQAFLKLLFFSGSLWNFERANPR